MTIYVSYDGMLEPLGRSQVVSYLAGLSSRYEIVLISFEKPRDLRDKRPVEQMAAELAERGVRWIRLRYHKSPPVLSTLYDALCGVIAGARIARASRVAIVHARGYQASIVALVLKRLFGMKFLFDMRGFWADEKVDAGHWSRRSLVYKTAKRCERRFLESADAIVSLTREGVNTLPSLGRIPAKTPIEVITTCTDLEKFFPGPKNQTLASRLGLDGRFVIGCTGTLSNWYLREVTLAALAYLARQYDRARVLIVTREDHAHLRLDARAAGLQNDRLVITEAPFTEMPEYLRLMDLGLFFIKPVFSKKGSSATKLGEFLATGVPVVINDGVGDSGAIVREQDVGVVLARPHIDDLVAATPAILQMVADPLVSRRCRRAAETYFDLKTGTAKYAALYDRLLGQAVPAGCRVW